MTRPSLSVHLIVLIVGSILFFWWFHCAGLRCGGIVETPQQHAERLSKMPPVEQKLVYLFESSCEVSAYLRVLTARSNVLFVYFIFLAVLFGDCLFRRGDRGNRTST